MSPSRRPASAPVRVCGRHAYSPPGCETAARPQSGGRQGEGALSRATERRPGSALARNRAHQTRGHDPCRDIVRDQRTGSPLPPPAWGVRPFPASSIAAGTFTRDFKQTDRAYEEVVVCRGSRRVFTGSAARDKKQRHQGGGLHGRDPTWLGLLEGSPGGGGCGGESLLDLAINPSPWGAFVGGPPTTAIKTSSNQKRPSSAPRPLSMAGTPEQSLPSGFEAGGSRAQARPRSAHAASPSRITVSEALITRAYSSGPEKQRVSPPVALGGGGELQGSPSRSSLSRWPVSAVGEPLEEASGTDAERPRQASRARPCTVDEVSEAAFDGLCYRKVNMVQGMLFVLALCFVSLLCRCRGPAVAANS